jgi:hypothetical protein
MAEASGQRKKSKTFRKYPVLPFLKCFQFVPGNEASAWQQESPVPPYDEKTQVRRLCGSLDFCCAGFVSHPALS